MIGVPEPLFKTLEDPLIAELHKRFTPSTFIWDLRVGKIVNVADHPTADKLYLVTVDLGKEKRVAVAGLKEAFKKEQLLDQTVTLLCNLKAANFQGQQSQGMILVAAPAAGGAPQLLQAPSDVPLGTQIVPKGFQLGVKPNLDFRKDFQKEKFLTDDQGRAEFVDRDVDLSTKKVTERRVLLLCKVRLTIALLFIVFIVFVFFFICFISRACLYLLKQKLAPTLSSVETISLPFLA